VIDVYVAQRRDLASARGFFTAAVAVHGDPAEVITDRAPALANVIEDLVPAAWHNTGQYENNRVECDHGRLKARRLCCVDASHRGGEGGSMKRNRRPGPSVTMPSGFAGFRFPPEVILLAVRWYLRYGLS